MAGSSPFDFFHGSPCFDVGRISCARVFLRLLLRLLLLRLFEFRPRLLLELLVAVAVTAVVAAVIAIVTSRETLTFFTSPLGPAISFVVTEIVAIEALNVVLIALLLVVRSKGFIRAVLAPLEHTSVIFIRDKTDNLVRSNRVASTVSSCVETFTDIVVRGGEGTQ